MPRRTARSTPATVAAGLLAGLIAALPVTQAADPGATVTRGDFCAAVQNVLAGTALAPKNTIHTDWGAFRKSKPAIRPLETQQFVEYEDAAGTRPKRISCKTKTWDQIRDVYGADAARDGGAASCRDVNRDTIMTTWRAMTPAERARAAHPPQRIMLDGDENVIMGSKWVEPYEFAYLGSDGRVHVQARTIEVGFKEWPWRLAPAQFRGTYYCHLIAPEYARRVMLGEARIEARSTPRT
jgi:hypothetical protein